MILNPALGASLQGWRQCTRSWLVEQMWCLLWLLNVRRLLNSLGHQSSGSLQRQHSINKVWEWQLAAQHHGALQTHRCVSWLLFISSSSSDSVKLTTCKIHVSSTSRSVPQRNSRLTFALLTEMSQFVKHKRNLKGSQGPSEFRFWEPDYILLWTTDEMTTSFWVDVRTPERQNEKDYFLSHQIISVTINLLMN